MNDALLDGIENAVSDFLTDKRQRDLREARRIAKNTRREMRGWALWWRRGSPGATAEMTLKGAVNLRNIALNMEAQARRLETEARHE